MRRHNRNIFATSERAGEDHSPARFCFGREKKAGREATLLTVVAALIEWDGKLLVCQRRRGSMFELMWEFPGGKAEPEEDLRAALVRELEEELGVQASVERELYRQVYQYEQMSEATELVFFTARAEADTIRNRVFERIEWRGPKELGELNFLPGDRDLIEMLASGKLRLSTAP